MTMFRNAFRRLLEMGLGGVVLGLIGCTLWYLGKGVAFTFAALLGFI